MRSFWLALVVVTSCTHLKAKEQTVAEHRSDAVLHRQRSLDERAKYDATEVKRVPPRSPMMGAELGGQAVAETYNPTSDHLAKADREMRLANEHLAAANTLRAFENQACAGLAAGERASCPLLASSVSRVRSTPRGFLLTIRADADVGLTYRRLNCHLAYAVSTGFDRPSCPLFVKGLTLSRDGESDIVFTGENPVVAEALKVQARRIFVGDVVSVK